MMTTLPITVTVVSEHSLIKPSSYATDQVAPFVTYNCSQGQPLIFYLSNHHFLLFLMYECLHTYSMSVSTGYLLNSITIAREGNVVGENLKAFLVKGQWCHYHRNLANQQLSFPPKMIGFFESTDEYQQND